MELKYKMWVGIDWASEEHQVCVIDGERRIVDEFKVPHSGAGQQELFARLLALADGASETIAVAIETPRGAVVEGLVEHGFAVYALNPKQLDRFRDRHTVAGAKDDRRDGFVLADSLRTDEPLFHRVKLDDPLIIQLRDASRTEEELTRERIALANRLRDQLLRFYASLLTLCGAADEPWLWTLLDAAPTPEAGARMRHVTLLRLLQKNRIRRFSAEELMAVLRAPRLRVAPGVVDAASEHVALLVERLRLVDKQLSRCRKRSDALLDQLAAAPAVDSDGKQREHRDVQILRSLDGVGRSVAATVLAEASQPLAARDYHALRAQAGVAPVTRQTGKQGQGRRKVPVSMRQACNERLRDAMFYWARGAMQRNPLYRAQYHAAIRRGQKHGRALRGIADRLLAVLVAMLKSGTLYDPNHPRCSPYAFAPSEVAA
jgi:transposase